MDKHRSVKYRRGMVSFGGAENNMAQAWDDWLWGRRGARNPDSLPKPKPKPPPTQGELEAAKQEKLARLRNLRKKLGPSAEIDAALEQVAENQEWPNVTPVKEKPKYQYRCPKCRKGFNDEEELTKHVKRHRKLPKREHHVKCVTCGKTLWNGAELDKHYRTEHRRGGKRNSSSTEVTPASGSGATSGFSSTE